MKKLFICLSVLFLSLSSLTNAESSVNEYKPVPKSKNTHVAYIEDMFIKDGKLFVVADYIQWFEGEEADKVFREYESDPEVTEAPDGYYILNVNDKLRTFEVTANAPVFMQIYNRTGNIEEADIVWNERIDAKKLHLLFKNKNGIDISEYPYHLTIKGNKIVNIVQQYIP